MLELRNTPAGPRWKTLMARMASRESLRAGMVGAALWGSWAFYVQLDHGYVIAGRSALTQLVSSLVLVNFMTMLMEWSFSRKEATSSAMLATSMILPVAFTSSTLTAVHYLNGTPSILKTILPSQVVGLVWTIVYTTRLYGRRRAP